MSGRRNRSQARRTGRNGMPGWAWLLVGLVIGAGALWAWSSWRGGDDDFLRPQPNPDARPADAVADEPIATEDPATQYDFYTLLPGDGVALSDEELAASARAEAEAATQAPADADDAPVATAEPGTAPRADGSDDAPEDAARYVLQAGAFATMGDAESVKARIALLGLAARVEPATSGDGRPVYRVRLGPYATAAELADAKRKLADGGLPSLAIRAR